jgi:dUTP pyrophosphatase
MTVLIKKLNENAKLPVYAHQGDAGMDFFSSESLTIKSKQRALVSTGISMAIPNGFVGLIWDKSGLAAKQGLTALGGVIDSGYRGEIKIIIYNTNDQDYQIEAGQKIAQMLIQKIESPQLVQTTDFDQDTSRGEGGFGSTGLQ